MSEIHQGHEYLPEEMLSLSAAIAQRNIHEHAWAQSIIRGDVPDSNGFPVEIMQSIQTGTTVAMLNAIEDPEALIDPISMTRTVLDDTAINNLIISLGETPNDEIFTTFRGIVDAQTTVIWEQFVTDAEVQTKFVTILNLAKAIADNYSVETSEVYEQEHLYIELMRAYHTPQSYADEALQAMKKLNQEFVWAMADTIVTPMMQAEITDGLITPEELEKEKSEIMRDLLEDKAMMETIDSSISAMRFSQQKVAVQGLRRFWGEDALDMLESDTRAQLEAVGTGPDDLSKTLLQGQRRNDIVALLCQEKGWDPRRLTVEQTAQINLSPAIKELDSEEDF